MPDPVTRQCWATHRLTGRASPSVPVEAPLGDGGPDQDQQCP
jgi:hypothetical protein